MENRCVICAARDLCDMTEWVWTEDGSEMQAKDIEDCPDFVLDLDKMLDFVADAVIGIDPDKYLSVQTSVSMRSPSMTKIYNIYVGVLEFPEDLDDRAAEIVEVLQEMNDEALHIRDALWETHFMEFDDVGNEVEDMLHAFGEPELEWECPICGKRDNHKPKACKSCGYEPLAVDL